MASLKAVDGALLKPSCRCLGGAHIKLPVWGAKHSVAVSLQQRAVIRRGLLDSYRQQKGMVSEQGSHQASERKLRRHPRTVTPTRGPRGNDNDDDELCSPECVREIFTVEEFEQTMQNENPNTLIVVDFYKTACGSCRYIQPGFVKLCHSSEEEHAPVVFLKHNVIDEADQATDLGEKLRIRNVPLFQFYKDGELLDQFATRDKKRIGNAINTHVGWEVCHF